MQYPENPLSFPWFKHQDQSRFPYVMYPNWGYGNRPPLPANASKIRVAHYRCDTSAFRALDFDILYFSSRLKKGDRVIMAIQLAACGSIILTSVATIQCIRWGENDPFPEIWYHCNGRRSIWPTYLLGIAPVNPRYKETELPSIEEVQKASDTKSRFLDFVNSYGIHRSCRRDIPLFQVGSVSEFDQGVTVGQSITGEHLLLPGDKIEYEAGSNIRGWAEIVTADDTPSGGCTNVTIKRLS